MTEITGISVPVTRFNEIQRFRLKEQVFLYCEQGDCGLLSGDRFVCSS
ncbi:hypothetical protein [Nostoc sp.]